jgi:hypothetical protein
VRLAEISVTGAAASPVADGLSVLSFDQNQDDERQGGFVVLLAV